MDELASARRDRANRAVNAGALGNDVARRPRGDVSNRHDGRIEDIDFTSNH